MTTIKQLRFKSSRKRYLDATRGFAVFVMIFSHCHQYLDPLFPHFNFQGFQGGFAGSPPWFEIVGLRLTGAAVMFHMLAGVSFALVAHATGSQKDLCLRILRRAALLLFLGIAFGSGCRLFQTGVFTLQTLFTIGCGLPLLLAFAKTPALVDLALGIGLLLVRELVTLSPPTQSLSAADFFYRFVWTGGPFGQSHIFVLYTLIGWFPLMLFGLSFGKLLLRLENKESPKHFLFVAASLWSLFLVLRFLPFGSLHAPKPTDINTFLTLSKYPPSLHYVLYCAGFFFMVLAAMRFSESRGRQLFGYFCYLGIHSLPIYLVHYTTLSAFRLAPNLVASFGSWWVATATWFLIVSALYILYVISEKKKPVQENVLAFPQRTQIA